MRSKNPITVNVLMDKFCIVKLTAAMIGDECVLIDGRGIPITRIKRKHLGLGNPHTTMWNTWARLWMGRIKRGMISETQWGQWAASVAAGSRRRCLSKVADSRPEKRGGASRGWLQASRRMKTQLDLAINRQNKHVLNPWNKWAETVGSNCAKRKRLNKDKYPCSD